MAVLQWLITSNKKRGQFLKVTNSSREKPGGSSFWGCCSQQQPIAHCFKRLFPSCYFKDTARLTCLHGALDTVMRIYMIPASDGPNKKHGSTWKHYPELCKYKTDYVQKYEKKAMLCSAFGFGLRTHVVHNQHRRSNTPATPQPKPIHLDPR